MPLRILIVPDKFKGTLTAGEAAEAMARGWRLARSGDELELLPMSDGGDGFGEVMGALIGAVAQVVRTVDAAHRPCRARWWWEPKGRTAIVESAEVIGLAMLPPGKFHPFEVDSYGLGQVLRAAAEKGARRCLIGLGGSATNDGGFGVAKSFGWQFLTREGAAIENWVALSGVHHVVPGTKCPIPELVVAVDVQNPLLGPKGASRIYGPQKGLKAGDFAVAERSLSALAALVERKGRKRLDIVPGAGAAGGLGFGLLAFFAGRLERGFDLFAEEACLRRRLRRKDLVLTGEGAIDDSTLMGKGAGQVAELCHKLRVPCIGLAGCVGPSTSSRKLFSQINALTELTSLSRAKKQPAKWLERLTKQVGEAYRLAHEPRRPFR